MAVDENGEHTRQIWLTDSELETVRKGMRWYVHQLPTWTKPATKVQAEMTLEKLERE
jgi:hypothetical protein